MGAKVPILGYLCSGSPASSVQIGKAPKSKLDVVDPDNRFTGVGNNVLVEA